MRRKTQKYPQNPKIAPYNERLLEEKSMYPMVYFFIAQSGRNIKRYPKNGKIPKISCLMEQNLRNKNSNLINISSLHFGLTQKVVGGH